ncbi:hypothetical protein GCM10010433_03650 [Streptomyces pulveraceus]
MAQPGRGHRHQHLAGPRITYLQIVDDLGPFAVEDDASHPGSLGRPSSRSAMVFRWIQWIQGLSSGSRRARAPRPDLGPVFKLPSAVRRPARTLAALSGSPRYIQYRGDPPPCDRTHRTPHGPASGRTTAV